MSISSPCPKAAECSNLDVRCDLCVGFNFFKTGKSRAKGARHEQAIVKAINIPAHLRRGSGASPYAKGDVIDQLCLHEGKSGYSTKGRGKKSIVIQREWLLKIQREALAEGKLPLLQLHFDDTPEDEIWTVLSQDVLQELLEELVALRTKAQ